MKELKLTDKNLNVIINTHNAMVKDAYKLKNSKHASVYLRNHVWTDRFGDTLYDIPSDETLSGRAEFIDLEDLAVLAGIDLI